MRTCTVRLAIAIVTGLAFIALGMNIAVAQDAPFAHTPQQVAHAHHDHMNNILTYSDLRQGGPSITVNDQPLADDTLIVAEVVAMEDGWIAVHTVEAHDKPILNQIVGTALVSSGSNTNVQVKLKESFQPGDRLQVMLHVDQGVKGTFEFPSGPDAAVRVGEQVLTKPISVLRSEGQPAAIMPMTGQANVVVQYLFLAAFFVILVGVGARRLRRHV